MSTDSALSEHSNLKVGLGVILMSVAFAVGSSTAVAAWQGKSHEKRLDTLETEGKAEAQTRAALVVEIRILRETTADLRQEVRELRAVARKE